MVANVPGIVGIALFYVLILVIGLWAARSRSKKAQENGSTAESGEEVMLAGRSIGLFVGAFTMTGINRGMS